MSLRIIPHEVLALPTGIIYSGRVPFSITDLLIIYPSSSTSFGAGWRVGTVSGSTKYDSSSFVASLGYGRVSRTYVQVAFDTPFPLLQLHLPNPW